MNNPGLSPFFKSVIEQDTSPVIICDLTHTIIYMNPAGAEAEKRHGGYELVGKCIFDCHNADSCEKIKRVVEWFQRDAENNVVHTFHNAKVNKDVYMVALRDDNGGLIGYYEKHCFRDPESGPRYRLD